MVNGQPCFILEKDKDFLSTMQGSSLTVVGSTPLAVDDDVVYLALSSFIWQWSNQLSCVRKGC